MVSSKIKICKNYIYEGKTLTEFPHNIRIFENCKPEYIEVDGWQQDIRKCRKFEDLPKQAQDYVKKIEELCNVKASIISIGPDREETIIV